MKEREIRVTLKDNNATVRTLAKIELYHVQGLPKEAYDALAIEIEEAISFVLACWNKEEEQITQNPPLLL